ncbi:MULTISPECIES: Na+/H+ antiporter subunit G [Pseudomonas syringae group]|uniref:Monovalent cation/H+ antiporter subunit G n=4 Tax=Pseudomonas syringae group TaxID=136849 RepID=A0A0P9PAR3_PSECA|nr:MULTISPECIES: Na+/H+ antiporter subunit G [Pseudomonas syringae group]KAA8709734.1 Na+/H+ antiporter subunit G [Pseudomonas cannabina]KPB69537.1 putative monovalent cation/H+ antiporter subunit G [Pseudomonas syringae pv. maculicola]KPW19121.1 putative monovalent cation/H+ antiporter subunit G [Pseudomonas cannabina pv. alisalensis]KPW81677.1 putative monovalent cation/H+ antiporter subunit G [Pseudomonas cannabina]MBM0137424.1 Na+/H+ antiporter subunit G [Pseudomonas cannabina pv. alisalen
MNELSGSVPFWAEILTAGLLIVSSLFALTGAIGLLRLKDFFQRMHPPALASTLGAWCVALASIIYFSALKSEPVIHAWLIPVLLAITVPVTTLLLARTALFRKRMAGDDVPAEVSSGRVDGESSGG